MSRNEDKYSETRTSETSNQTERHKEKHLKLNCLWQQMLPHHMPGVPSTDIWLHVYLCVSHCVLIGPRTCLDACLSVCLRVCAGKYPAQSQNCDPTLRHHNRLCHMTGREPEVDRTMLLVLAISLRDNKRQQKGFQRKYSSIALYPLNLGYWFKYETCTPQEEWQTSTSLSFFIFFPPFTQI